jgi:hypothetical protein
MKKITLLFLLLFVGIYPAHADCIMVDSKNLVKQTDFIFVGKVIKTNKLFGFFSNEYKSTFKITERIKGKETTLVDIHYNYNKNIAPTTRPIEEGRELLVFVRKHPQSKKYMFRSPCIDRTISMDIIRKKTVSFRVIEDLRAIFEAYPEIKNNEILKLIDQYKGKRLGF